MLLPKTYTLEWFAKVLNYSNFTRSLLNSLIVALGTICRQRVVGCMTAYSLSSRPNLRGRNLFSRIILIAYMFPRRSFWSSRVVSDHLRHESAVT